MQVYRNGELFTTVNTVNEGRKVIDQNQKLGELWEINTGSKERYFSKLHYAKDDPVWDSQPSLEDCHRLWGGIIQQAVFDSTAGKSVGKEVTDILTVREKPFAQAWLKSAACREACEHIGLNQNHLQRSLKERNLWMI